MGASTCWQNEVTFNIAANHVAKTKGQESDSTLSKSTTAVRAKLDTLCVSFHSAAQVAAVVGNIDRHECWEESLRAASEDVSKVDVNGSLNEYSHGNFKAEQSSYSVILDSVNKNSKASREKTQIYEALC